MAGKDFFRIFSRSYAAKIVLFITILIVGIITVQTFIFVQSETRYLQDSLIEDKKNFAELLVINLEVAQTIAGFAFQSNLIKDAGETKDTVYVRFVKPNGEIYLSTISEEVGKFIKDPVMRTEKTVVKNDVHEGERIKVVISPVHGGYTIWLGFSLQGIQIIVNERARDILITSLIILVIVNFVAYFIAKKMTNPLKELRKGVEIIGKGNLDYKVDIKSRDEIGQLASAFNQMTQDLKRSEEQIRKHAEELEQKVMERTKDLDAKVKELTDTKIAVLNMMEDMEETNRELIKTQEELKESLEELKEVDIKKDEFISIAAHELKTPLTSIHGFSQLLQNREVAKVAEKREKYLKIMDHETKRLAKLVNDILDLSRIDLGTIKLAYEEVDVNELVDTIRREMNIQITEKGLDSEYDIEKAVPQIVTDREKLTEILINLINNAVKYTPKGKITVKIFREKNDMHFMVKDTGIGIAKENQPHIFERFYQVDSSYTRKASGVGLGLSLCKEFVNVLGGKIWFSSELGKGSEFHFTLPIKSVKKEVMNEEERKAREILKKSEQLSKKLEKTGIKS
jgi:signal transduction histidine kinase/HAMP domain-containing protein